ncbi:undecaprenyl/decaprenyl-phosphate alpha-N-acetylglucosaminyl 1-phosphate transferase [Actinoallomurus purpureus]|uniref:MraY family glycosyltransferase n=1 Tax=Actinoallomurus purpureus TaxID=478114 RepID=UPI0020923618|nr:MraY family glycosyltransferase [Actinoallomurus purpureus]MCO6005116.1 undecaprenyl/decaprenyl-phosphate alpha-N-acetylglucosaminyl 1-phosphate transferase [Actinoallomurus purpureus]
MAVPPWLTAAGAALAALVLADVLSEGLGRYALRRGLTDRPDVRKAHTRPTPYLGGVAIAVGALASGTVSIPHWDRRITVLVLAGVVVALVGLFDDLRPTHPAFRLVLEGGAATAVVMAGGRIGLFGHWLDPVVTAVWIVVLTNSFNLLDNMDGAAATVAAASGCLIAGAAYLGGQSGLALLLMTLSAGCLGFLVHNWAPARMFMGDAGSLFIGFLLAAAAVMVRVPAGTTARLAELFLFTFVATVDTCLVVIARPRAGRGCFTAGTDHVSHRLRTMGFTVPQVALTLFAIAAVAGLCGVGVAAARLPGILTLAAAATGAAVLVLLLMKVPVYAAPDAAGIPPATASPPGSGGLPFPRAVRVVDAADEPEDRRSRRERGTGSGPGSVLHIDERRK